MGKFERTSFGRGKFSREGANTPLKGEGLEQDEKDLRAYKTLYQSRKYNRKVKAIRLFSTGARPRKRKRRIQKKGKEREG